jgi:hypothetical protein
MLHHSKFPLFALLALLLSLAMLSMVLSSCGPKSFQSIDQRTAEDILLNSTDNAAKVALTNGDTIVCSAIAVRTDTTTWRQLGKDVSVPTNSIASIEVTKPEPLIGTLIGLIAVGASLSLILLIITALSPLFLFSGLAQAGISGEGCFVVVILLGLLAGGGVLGGNIGASNKITYTNAAHMSGFQADSISTTRDTTHKNYYHRNITTPMDTLRSSDTSHLNMHH